MLSVRPTFEVATTDYK